MCMFALTVSTAEPKNIKEAMADSAWIEEMHEELHHKGLCSGRGIDFEESFAPVARVGNTKSRFNIVALSASCAQSHVDEDTASRLWLQLLKITVVLRTLISSIQDRFQYLDQANWIHKDGDGDASFQLESDSLPHAHAQTTKTYYKHQDSRIMKAQELKTKTSAQTLIYKIFLQRYQVYQGRLLASFQDDAKYEHVGQDTRSQGGKDDQDGRIKI
ncbi:hypothetical protein Tco_0852096 [Tanacetum coccineum]